MRYDYIALQHQYPDEYVATSGDEVVAHSKDLAALYAAIGPRLTTDPDLVVGFVEPPDIVTIY
jgi:hypothetical protein